MIAVCASTLDTWKLNPGIHVSTKKYSFAVSVKSMEERRNASAITSAKDDQILIEEMLIFLIVKFLIIRSTLSITTN